MSVSIRSEQLMNGGGRVEVRKWRLTYLCIFRQELSGGWSSGGGSGGWQWEGGGQEMEANMLVYIQTRADWRSEQWWRVRRLAGGGWRSGYGG